jgi:hypothetical protein
MSARGWIKAITALCLVFSVFSLGSVSAAPADAAAEVVEVATVDELYDAVYDEYGAPRENIEIRLADGIYALDPTQPFNGRLVLGDGSSLKGGFVMDVDANGVPKASGNAPVVLHAGAKIDGSALVLMPPTSEGLIVVGDRGAVEHLWIDGGTRPGVEIIARGTARHVASTGHWVGFRVRAAGLEAKGILEQCLAVNNSLFGIGVIALGPSMPHPTYAGVEVQATLDRTASLGGARWNLLVYGGLGTDDSTVHAKAFHSVFSGAAETNVLALGGVTYLAHGGANYNQVKLTFVDVLIADGQVGLSAQGGVLWPIYWDPSLPVEENKNSGNEVKVSLSRTSFAGNAADITAYGAFSVSGVSSGDENQVKVIIPASGTPDATVEVWPCFLPDAFPNCTNEVAVLGPGG